MTYPFKNKLIPPIGDELKYTDLEYELTLLLGVLIV